MPCEHVGDHVVLSWTLAATLDGMPQATSTTAIDRIMDHRVLALRDGASTDPIVSLSWYTYSFSRSGAVGNLAFWRDAREPDRVALHVLTDSPDLARAMTMTSAPKADRDRFAAVDPTPARFEIGPLGDPHRCTIHSPLGLMTASWSALEPPLFAVGPSPAYPDTYDISSTLIEAADATIEIDGRSITGAPYPNEGWTAWLGRPLSSALIALGEVLVDRAGGEIPRPTTR